LLDKQKANTLKVGQLGYPAIHSRQGIAFCNQKEHSLEAGVVLMIMGPAREIRLFTEEVEACTNY